MFGEDKERKIFTGVFHGLKEDCREDVARCLRGGGKCKWQNAQVATKEIPTEHKEKNSTVRAVKHWSRLLMETVEPPSNSELTVQTPKQHALTSVLKLVLGPDDSQRSLPT